MSLLSQFLDQSFTSLKICGITSTTDAHRLVEENVDALGINFWEKSKRFCSEELAKTFSPEIAGKILRVGVFVNTSHKQVLRCFEENLIDLAQFHGDEDEAYLKEFSAHKLPFLKAIGLVDQSSVSNLERFHTNGLLLDAHAPGVFGGTGKTVDWNLSSKFVTEHPKKSVLLAGGITPINAREAVSIVHPCAIDIASGAEKSPGIKDFTKVKLLQEALSE